MGRCARCGRAGAFGALPLNTHHRRPRGMGGTKRGDANGLANLLTLCGSGTTGCHGWVESHRAEARAAGLLVSLHADPQDVPVQTWRGLLLLDNAGGEYQLATDD